MIVLQVQKYSISLKHCRCIKSHLVQFLLISTQLYNYASVQHSHASENAAICTAVSKNYYKTRNF